MAVSRNTPHCGDQVLFWLNSWEPKPEAPLSSDERLGASESPWCSDGVERAGPVEVGVHFGGRHKEWGSPGWPGQGGFEGLHMAAGYGAAILPPIAEAPGG